MNIQLSLIVLYTEHMGRTLKFYSLLGLRFNEEKHGSGPQHYSCTIGGTVLELYPVSLNSPPPDRIRIGFSVHSMPDTLERLASMGIQARPVRRTKGGESTFITDPDGRTVEIST